MCKVHHKPHYCELLGLLVRIVDRRIKVILEIQIMALMSLQETRGSWTGPKEQPLNGAVELG